MLEYNVLTYACIVVTSRTDRRTGVTLTAPYLYYCVIVFFSDRRGRRWPTRIASRLDTISGLITADTDDAFMSHILVATLLLYSLSCSCTSLDHIACFDTHLCTLLGTLLCAEVYKYITITIANILDPLIISLDITCVCPLCLIWNPRFLQFVIIKRNKRAISNQTDDLCMIHPATQSKVVAHITDTLSARPATARLLQPHPLDLGHGHGIPDSEMQMHIMRYDILGSVLTFSSSGL